MKKNKFWLIGFLTLLIFITGKWLIDHAGVESDLRTVQVSDKGLEIISLSFKRKMVSKIVIGGDEELWLPGGYGWYRAGSVQKLLKDEKKDYLWDKILFFNFGFDTDLWTTDNQDLGLMINKWGWLNWIKYKMTEPDWLYKEESLTDLKRNGGLIDKLMLREMADSEILESKIRVNVYNATMENGLAAFMGKNIERLGFSVNGWETVDPEDMLCKIIISDKQSKNRSVIILEKQMKECEKVVDNNLLENEVEIYFGEKYPQMINYKSYVGTF